MKLIARSLCISSLALSATVAGGAIAAEPAPSPGPATPSNPANTQATPPKAEPAAEAPRDTAAKAPAQMHGFVRLIDDALSQIPLRPEQSEALQKLATKVRQSEATVHDAKRNLMLALADQLESGRIDPSALQPQMDALVAASQAATPVMRNAIEELHRTLDAQQRAMFVELLQRQMQGRSEMGKPGTLIDAWAKDLGLSDNQKEQVASILEKAAADINERRQTIQKILDAFKADTFTLDEIVPVKDVAAHGKAMAQRIVDMTKLIASVLTPQQRTQAATKIRDIAKRPETPAKPAEPPAKPTNKPAEPQEDTGATQSPIHGYGGIYGVPGAVYAPGYVNPVIGYDAVFGYPLGYDTGYATGYAYPTWGGYNSGYAYRRNSGYSRGYSTGYGYYPYAYPYVGGWGYAW